jgi:hypothetical protein
MFILRIDNKLKADGEPRPLKKIAEVTPKSTVWRVIKS